MKKISLIVLALFSLRAGAQYFQHSYGSQNLEILSSGVNTVAQGQGHLMSGHTRTTCLPFLGTLPVVFTDVNGDIPGTPYFAYNYVLNRDNGEAVQVIDSRAFEIDNSTGFGIVGTYSVPSLPFPGNSGIFYLQLDPAGTRIQVFDYFIANTSYSVKTVSSICESSTGSELYITGTAADINDSYFFAMKIDVNTGTIIWDNIYDINIYTSETGSGICESVHMPGEVAVVGTAANTSLDGFLVRLDANNGNILAPANFYGTPSDDEIFNSIRVANNTAAGAAGFIIGGIVNSEAWVVNTDAMGNPNWASLFDYSPIPGTYNSCNDVIERFNTNGKWEYYAGGTADDNGTPVAHVIKIDEMGNGVPAGEFIYTNASRVHMLDMYTAGTAPPNGLSVYATVHGGSADMYLVKAYFNGLSGCFQKFGNPLQYSAPSLYTSEPVSPIDNFAQANMRSCCRYTMTDLTVCYSASLVKGNNARVAPASNENADKAATVMPNPAETAAKAVIVEVESDMPGEVEITLVDVQGKETNMGHFSLVKGDNRLSLDTGKNPVPAGTYTVKINGVAINKNILLMVK